MYFSNLTCRLKSDYVNPICDCPRGYEGERCEKCAVGYHGNPYRGEECRSQSQCDINGSISIEPDAYTTMCQCKVYFCYK